MSRLIGAAIGHARTVLAALALILIAGTVAYREIPKESDPDVNIPILYISLHHEGISAEDAERLLVRPVEQKMRAIDGIKEMRSRAFENGGNVILEFEAGFDVDKAMADVREKVDQAKPDLPDGTDEPTVNEINFSLFPVLVVTLAGEVPERTLLRVGRDLRDAIEALPPVLKVEIAGNRDELVEILIDPVKVQSYGLTIADATRIMRASNLLIAAGSQDTGQGRFAVKVPGLFRDVREILALPLRVDGDAVVALGDIGEVRRTFKDPESFARVGGRPAMTLEVTKRTGENVIDTIEAVKRVVEAEREGWPDLLRQAVEVAYTQDRSRHIRTMLADLQNNVISAILLVMIVVVGALGLRSGLLVGIAVPGSFLTGILVLAALGLTINIVVLFSLILAVGMLVDGAIVVVEYADRKMIEGEPRRRAYALAARRMAWPIIASTATTLAAFLPLLFWPGVVGEFMKFLPLTLIATLSASLAMALLFVPTLGAQIGRPGAADAATMAALAGSEGGDLTKLPGLTGVYVRSLRPALRHPAKVLTAAVAVLVAVQGAYATWGRGIEFFPDVEPDFVQLQVRARGNLSTAEKDALLREVEARILDMAEFETLYARTGRPERSEDAEDIIGTISIELADWQRRRPVGPILEEVRARTAGLAGIVIDRRKQEAGPPVGKPVQVELSARAPEALGPAADRMLAALAGIGGFINVEDGRPPPGIDWVIEVDRAQAAKFAADVELIGKAVQMATTGIKLGAYRPDDSDDEIDIRVRYPVLWRNIEQLDRIRINTEAGDVPIGLFVKRGAKPHAGTIQRTGGRRAMTIKADVEEGLLVDAKVKEIQAWLKDADLDPGVKVRFKGEDEEQKRAEAFLVKAFVVALFVMAIILVTQFNSFYSAALILSAVVMSTIGVFIGLLVTGRPFGIVMGGIGVIALAGIVVNNNIVLIDTFDRLKATAASAEEAILRTGAQRLRPVLLTTATTMLGLIPMVTGVNIDFVTREVTVGAPSTQWWSQLATAIVYGLGFATVLTLVVTPSALMLRANVAAWRRRRHAQAPEAGGAAAPSA